MKKRESWILRNSREGWRLTFAIRFRAFLHETDRVFHELFAWFSELLNLIHGVVGFEKDSSSRVVIVR